MKISMGHYEPEHYESTDFLTAMVLHRIATLIRYIKGEVLVMRNDKIIGSRDSHRMWKLPRPIQSVSPENDKVQVSTNIHQRTRIKPMWSLNIRRNEKLIYTKKRIRDLLIWRGQSTFAYNLSFGNVGTKTKEWCVVASENDIAPDMGDDSGSPLDNEFYPLIGSPVDVTYEFEPEVKPSGLYQTIAVLTMKGTVISDGAKTLRKIGIIDCKPPPPYYTIIEDSVIPFDVILDDEIEIYYTVQFG